MKKFAVLIYVLAVILVGCGRDLPFHESVDEPDFYNVTLLAGHDKIPSFDGVVLEVYGSSILIEADEGSPVRASSDKLSVSTDIESHLRPDKISAGDRVRVFYSGAIMETYPAQLHQTEAIYRIGADGSLIPNE